MIPTLLILLAMAAGDGQAAVLVRYDLRPVIPRFDRGSGWSQALVPDVAKPYEKLPAVTLHELYEEAAPEVILDLVTQILGDELVFEGRAIALERNSSLLVLAPPETQTKVADILAVLESVLSASVQLRLDVLTLTDAGGEVGAALLDRNVVPEAEAERLVEGLVARGASHKEHVFQLSAGRTSAVDQVRNISFLFDYDVEIAQGAFIYDPIIMQVQDGLRLFVRGVPVPGGVSLALVVLHGGLVGEIEERPLNVRGAVGSEQKGGLAVVQGPQSVQSARLLTRSVAFSTLLPDDRALVAACEANVGGRSERQILVLRRIGGGLRSFSSHPISGTQRTLMMVNTELLGVPEFSIVGGPWMHSEFKGHPWLVGVLNAEPSSFLFEWMKYRYSVWRRLGPWVLIVTDPSWDNHAGDELAELVAGARPETDLIEVAIDLCTEDAGAPRPVRWSLPVLAGTEFGTVLGQSGTVIKDYDVEVAQFAAVPDPVMMSTFDGLALAAEVSRGGSAGGSGAWIIEARGTAHLFRGPTAAFTPQAALSGRIELPEYDSLLMDERVTVPRKSGAASRVRIGPRSVGPPGLYLELTVGGS